MTDDTTKRLRELLRSIVKDYDRSNPMRTADAHNLECTCLRCLIDEARSVLEGK
jgi:hypothetical protein